MVLLQRAAGHSLPPVGTATSSTKEHEFFAFVVHKREAITILTLLGKMAAAFKNGVNRMIGREPEEEEEEKSVMEELSEVRLVCACVGVCVCVCVCV
jgi:hypothetical protein